MGFYWVLLEFSYHCPVDYGFAHQDERENVQQQHRQIKMLYKLEYEMTKYLVSLLLLFVSLLQILSNFLPDESVVTSTVRACADRLCACVNSISSQFINRCI